MKRESLINYGVRYTLFVWFLKWAPGKKQNINSNSEEMALIDQRYATQLGIKAEPAAFSTRCSFRDMELLLGRNFCSTDSHNEPIETLGREQSSYEIKLLKDW